MSYNSSTKTITAPVSIQDVQQALNTNDKDLKDLCTENNINKWATFKPIKRPNITPIDVSTNLRNYYLEGTGEGGELCGIKGLRWLSVSFSTFLNGNNTTYPVGMIAHFNPQDAYYNDGTVYVRPVGGDNSPYRLSDFVLASNSDSIKFGYKHNAKLINNYISNGVIHTINCWSRSRNAEPYNYIIGSQDIILDYQPDGYTENWSGYSGISFLNKRLTSLTVEDQSIRLHDLIYAQWPGIVSSNIRHGILLYDPDNFSTWVFVGRIPLDDVTSDRTSEVKQLITTTRNTLSTYSTDNNKILHCVDFLTDAPETAGTTTANVFFDTSTTGTYSFVPIPSYIGYIYLKADSGIRIAQISVLDDGLYCDGNSFIYYVINSGQRVNQGDGYLWSFILNKCDEGIEPEAWLVGRKYNSETQTYSEDKIHHTVYNYDNNGTGTSEANSLIVGNMYSMFLKDYKNNDTGEYFYGDVKVAIYGYASSSSANKVELCSTEYQPLN